MLVSFASFFLLRSLFIGGRLLTNNYLFVFSCMFVNKLNNKTSVNKFSFASFA